MFEGKTNIIIFKYQIPLRVLSGTIGDFCLCVCVGVCVCVCARARMHIDIYVSLIFRVPAFV